jgi:hypothetical protein
MKRAILTLVLSAAAALALAAPAGAAFGLKDLELSITDAKGIPALQAGSHPFALNASFEVNTVPDAEFSYELPEGALQDLNVASAAGLVGNPTAVPQCPSAQFFSPTGTGSCPDASALGVITTSISEPGPVGELTAPVYNLNPPPGVAAEIGFWTLIVPFTIQFRVNPEPPYNVIASATKVPQVTPFYGSDLTLWGNPAAPSHDEERGSCIRTGGSCPVSIPEKPFLTLPTRCEGPLQTTFAARSWEGDSFAQTIATDDGATPPSPLGTSGCSKLGFNPQTTSKPTTSAGSSPSGLDFTLAFTDQGLTSPNGLAQSQIKKAVVRLPEGMSINPSIAEGLSTCAVAELGRETYSSGPGEGCPQASKVGDVEVETPLLEGQLLRGSLYVAAQYDNTLNTPYALYMVIKDAELGILVKLAGKIDPDERTGRLTTIFEGVPQFPFSEFRFHFREGARSPLAMPAACGTYVTEAEFTPWSGMAPIISSSTFEVSSGPNGGPCPSGGTPPFRPGLDAGTLNNAAGRYSPFNLRLSRNDGEQEFTRFSIKLPPGITGKLAGIPFCPDAAIAAAKARTGPHGGAEELASPSCPAASEVGRTLAGAGVGPSLSYAPGKVYLAGPYNGSALSIAAITAAKVGPFDLGTVVIREALEVNPETAEVFIDATGSDPIPHIIKGVPVHARDIRAYVDRPQFVLNPTSCERTSTASTVLGSGTDFASEADDRPFTVTSPFQAADCASLGFKPKLALSLRGGTKRGQNPGFKAVLTARPGDANIGRAQVTLPHSEFLDQSHIKTVCTRVQFKAGAGNGTACPAGSIYGYAKAITPLLDEPVEGPVFLRSSSNPLPDLVAALRNGQIDVNLVGRIDSVQNGRIRNTFDTTPDVPVKTFTLTMQGGKKGLLVNSTNLCRSTNRAIADFTGHNGKRHVFKPALKPLGCKKGKRNGNGKGKSKGRSARPAR